MLTLLFKLVKWPFLILRVSPKDLRTLSSPLAFQQHSSLSTPSGASLFTLRTNPTPKEKLCNLVYGLTCVAPDCGESYVGKTKQLFKARLNQHCRPSTNEAHNSAVYYHCKASNHSFKPEEAVILDKEGMWFERGVWEAIWERVEQPALNKKGAFASSCRMHGMRWSDIRRLPRRLSRDQSEAWWSLEFPDATLPHELQKLISSNWFNNYLTPWNIQKEFCKIIISKIF